MKTLGLPHFSAYRTWVEHHPSEWQLLDDMCRITISRFYRDWDVFDFLTNALLPQMAEKAVRENRPLRCWSAGCASGEEPYTLALIGHFVLKEKFPELDFQIVATDIDQRLLERARTGAYPHGSLKGLPEEWLAKAFSNKGNEYQIHACFGSNIEWLQQDIRDTIPPGLFDLVLCRNLVATYFEARLQAAIFHQIKTALRPGGILVLGCHERLPQGVEGFSVKAEKMNIYESDDAQIDFA